MSDLEMTRLCAQAMGYIPMESPSSVLTVIDGSREFTYQPLHDDAQAMALVKNFKLTVVWTDARLDGWRVRGWRTGKTGALCEEADADDLNRAIVECVSKLQRP